jgi:hypothetical protein
VIGLRVFTRAGNLVKENIFYTQRSHGPLYRWWYDNELEHWRVARVHFEDLRQHDLCTAAWKSMPQQLRIRLREHYLDL